ncbi:MAG: polyhydroxyalkanoate depolymerase [Myxococcota bacterium]
MLLKFWHDASQAALMPARAAAAMTAAVWGNEANPLSQTPGARMLVAGADLFDRLTRVYPKPEWNIREVQIDGHTVPIREEIADETPFYRLVRFTRDTSALAPSAAAALKQRLAGQPRGVLVTPMSGHHSTLLRATAQEMLKSGDVYVTEWKCASTVPAAAGEFGLADNVAHIRRALKVAGPGCHLTAVCQPSPAALAAVAFMSEDADDCKPRSLTLMAGPVDTRVNPQECNAFATKTSLALFKTNMLHMVPFGHDGFSRMVMPGLLQQAGFVGQNLAKHANAHIDYFWALVTGAQEAIRKHREFYDEYNALLDLQGKFYTETIDVIFQRHLLPKGELVLDGRRVDLSKIDVPLLVIEGGKDDICGVGQTSAAHELCTGIPAAKRAYYVEPEAGHYGVFNGKLWRANIAPRIAAFQTKWDRPSLLAA